MTSGSDAPETTAAEDSPDSASPTRATKAGRGRRLRAPWTLQAKLMTAVIAMVAVILVIVAVALSTILSQVLQQNLDARIQSVGRSIVLTPESTAADVLEDGRQSQGTLLVMRVPSGTSGAYVDSSGAVVALESDEIAEVVEAISNSTTSTVDIPGLGTYRINVGYSDRAGSFVVLGLPLSDIATTLAQILTTVALVTAGGLLLLSVVIAIVIRVGLRPLRAVAETASRVARMRMDQGSVSITERVPDEESDDRTEIGRVGAALNALLDHVDTSLTARQRNEELMRRFVADASHELRTPLASIRGYSELSLRSLSQGADAASTTQALERIQAQSLRMSALVEDLLLLARLDEGQELVWGTVDLTRLAVESVGDAQVAGRDHVWELDVDEEPVVVAGDTPRLHQVVANLLANARTHTPAGTTVTVSVLQDATDAVLRVHDTGPGIDPVVADELFERFARADTSRARQTGGTGLGLSIARAIVDAHNGSLTVRSAPGDTTFEMRIPARPASPGDDQ